MTLNWRVLILFCLLPAGFQSPFIWAQSPSPGLIGPMAGRNSAHEAFIWLQTSTSQKLSLRYWPKGKPELAQETPPQQSEASKAYSLQFEIRELEPDTRYLYEVRIGSNIEDLPFPLSFFTQSENPADSFRLALGSCAYVNDESKKTDRSLVKFGGRFGIFDSLARQKADYMLWLGDNVYFREGDWKSKKGMQERYRHTRARPEMQPLLATGHHLAIWDDHDFGPNDSDGSFLLKDSSLEVFYENWPNPAPEGEQGLYSRFLIGDIELFLMDGRYFRTPITEEDGPQKAFLGEVQIDWLISALKESRATFKFIAIGTQVFSDARIGEGYYDDYQHEWQVLMDRLVASKVGGIVFLSGDKHYTEVSRLDLPGFYPLFDLTFSPLTSQPTPVKLKNSRRVKKTFYNKRNFGILEFVGEGEERRVIIRTYKLNGKVKWERTIWAKWLRPGE